MSSTGDLVTISTSPNLTVSSLTPSDASAVSVAGGLQVTGLSQLQGIEAQGVVAQQVVWVTGGTGAPQSIMFPGSLALGKWRTRGSEAERFVLERFDDDGTTRTHAWLPVAAFTRNPDTNAASLESATVRTDMLNPLSQLADAAVTCDGHLVVTGRLTAGGVQMANNSAVVPGSLTFGGVGFALLNYTAVSPPQKVLNFQTGTFELRLDTTELGTPTFCAGRVSASATGPSFIGRVGYTVSRPNGFGTGVYRIDFASPAPNNTYVVSLAQLGNENIKLWDWRPDTPPPLPIPTL
jgi:hypothetical protein